MDGEWVHPLAKTLPSLWIFVMKYCRGWSKLKCRKKNHLVSDSNCNTKTLHPPTQKIQKNQKHNTIQGMTNIVGLAVSVGDTTPHFTISIEQDTYNW